MKKTFLGNHTNIIFVNIRINLQKKVMNDTAYIATQ